MQESRNLQLPAIAQAVALTQPATGITTNGDAAVRSDASDSRIAAEREAAAYTKFREEMAKEEKKEFRAKLWVALGLFIAVWLIGSAIFMATESWGFGTAVYFCEFPGHFRIFAELITTQALLPSAQLVMETSRHSHPREERSLCFGQSLPSPQ